MDSVRATYRIFAAGSVRERAEALALEQTVELPREALLGDAGRLALTGQVEAIEPDPEGSHRVTIAYPLAAVANDPAQLLNLLFGNASLLGDVELTDIELTERIAGLLGGPGHGIAGIRATAGVTQRPLTCVALKPMGLGPDILADLCFTFAAAGVDVIKDDHGLADAAHCPFEERLRACQAAIERAAERTGRRAVYAPNLIGPPSTLVRELEAAEREGVGAVVAAPLVIGLPAFHELARRSSVPVIAHPALGGGTRIAIPFLIGTLFRLYGADAAIFPHPGGRFPFGARLCEELADRLRRPGDRVRPALPVPAGGMSVGRVQEMVAFYGTDVMLLVGGTLYRAGDALADRAREFVDLVHAAAEGPVPVARDARGG